MKLAIDESKIEYSLIKACQLDIDLTPYRLNQYITDFRRELLYIGTTYYERHLVFEHLKRPITHFFGFEVTNIELYFSEEKLIAISLFLNESPDNDENVVKLIERRMDQKATLTVDQVLFRDIGSHIYTWLREPYKLALLTYWDTDQLFFQYSFKDF